jgi:hypothetical protein
MTYNKPRNRLTRLALQKAERDDYLNKIDRTQWYIIPDLHQLPQSSKFLQLNEDAETKQFIDNCYEKSDWFITQIIQSAIMSFLKWFMTNTSVNG